MEFVFETAHRLHLLALAFQRNNTKHCALINGFYCSFWDIPSAWWQASTIAMGIGVAIAVIGALTLLAAASSFLPHILKTPKHTRILGSLQLLAGEYHRRISAKRSDRDKVDALPLARL